MSEYMRDLTTDPVEGALRVWWNPQVGSGAGTFWVDVKTVAEAVKVMGVLAEYDLFQFENNVKPDYSNAGGLMRFEGGMWSDWYDDATGEDDPSAYVASHAAS